MLRYERYDEKGQTYRIFRLMSTHFNLKERNYASAKKVRIKYEPKNALLNCVPLLVRPKND